MSDYVSLEEMKNTLELSNLTYADTDLQDAISAASLSVDNHCGRQFASSGGTAEVRYYTATTSAYLEIDDASTVGTVKSDYDGNGSYETTWTLNTDYVLEPQNAAALGLPFNQILPLYVTSSLRFPAYTNGIQVTGEFGWGTVPSPVKVVTKILATRLLRRQRDAPFGVYGMGVDGSAMRIPRIDPDLEFLLDPYVRGGGVMVA